MKVDITKMGMKQKWKNELAEFFKGAEETGRDLSEYVKKFPQYKCEFFYLGYFITTEKNKFILAEIDELEEEDDGVQFLPLENGKYWNLFLVLGDMGFFQLE